jgi:hypothetical protein
VKQLETLKIENENMKVLNISRRTQNILKNIMIGTVAAKNIHIESRDEIKNRPKKYPHKII